MAAIKRSKQILKRIRQNQKRNLHLSSQRSAMRTSVKRVLSAIAAKDKDKATALFVHAQSQLDTMAKKGTIKMTKASRSKSRLAQKIKSIEVVKTEATTEE